MLRVTAGSSSGAEVRAAPWAEFDLDNRLWTIPGARTKNGREHTVWLADPALAILEKLPRIKGGAGFLFTISGEAHVSSLGRVTERIDEAMLAELRKAPEHWTFHDIRRTVYSGLQRLGFSIEVCEATVNHASGTLRGM